MLQQHDVGKGMKFPSKFLEFVSLVARVDPRGVGVSNFGEGHILNASVGVGVNDSHL